MAILLGLSYSVYAENIALIMGISQYQRNPLYGVYKDIDNAKKFAQSMNIPDKNIYIVKDQELTLKGLKQTLDKFSKSVTSDDRVFIYFSGHGTSSNRNGSCNQGIVTQDMEVMYRDDFQKYIEKITNKATKTLVFLDTCFSGGIVEQARAAGISHEDNSLQARSINVDEDSFPKAKFLDLKSVTGNSGKCRAQNYITEAGGERDFDSKLAEETPNYYYLGAASPSEAAIDGGVSVGGWATNALLSCVSQSDPQQITSGILTMSQVKNCAQKKIDKMIEGYKKQHTNFKFNAMTLTVGSGVGSGSMPVGFTYTQTNMANQKVNTVELFKNIMENGDYNKRLKLSVAKPQMKINEDNLELEVQSPVDGYLTLFITGSSGKIYQIFPDKIDGDNEIKANHKIILPKKLGHIYPSQGPAGKNTILAVVSPTKGRFDSLGIPMGNYQKIENTAINAKNITLSVLKPISSCGRDIGSVLRSTPECSTSYSAALIEIFEVE